MSYLACIYPACLAVTMPRLSSWTTRAPCSNAMSEVRSVLALSTTRISYSFGRFAISARIERMAKGISFSSLKAGIINVTDGSADCFEFMRRLISVQSAFGSVEVPRKLEDHESALTHIYFYCDKHVTDSYKLERNAWRLPHPLESTPLSRGDTRIKRQSVRGKTLIPDNVTDVSPHCLGFARTL